MKVEKLKMSPRKNTAKQFFTPLSSWPLALVLVHWSQQLAIVLGMKVMHLCRHRCPDAESYKEQIFFV